MIIFSITAHESYESINDFIESAVFACDDARVIIHVNASWTDFDSTKLLYINDKVFINPKRNVIRDKWVGKTGIHFSNIKYADELKLSYTHVVFHASNELYVKKINQQFINSHPFGHASACLLNDQPDFYAKPHHDNWLLINKIQSCNCTLMNELRGFGWYGGIGDGAFFSEATIHKMFDVWYRHYTDEFDLIPIDDEIIPLTLSMYVNNMRVDEIVDGLSVCSHQALTTEYVSDLITQQPDEFYSKHLHRALLFKSAENKFAVKGFIRHPTDSVRQFAKQAIA